MQLHKLCQVLVVERIGLAKVPPRVKLVVPDLARWAPFLKEENHGLHPRTEKRAAWAIEHRVKVAALEQVLSQTHGRIVRVREESVLDDDPSSSPRLENLDKPLQEQVGSLSRSNGEVLLDFFAFLAAERRIGKNHIAAFAVLDVREVFRKAIGVDDVGDFDPMQDQVHDRDHVSQRLLLLSVEGLFLKRLEFLGGQAFFLFHVVERLAQEPRRPASVVANALTDFWLDHLDHRSDERSASVVLAAVATRVAHVLDFGFVQVRKLMLLVLGTELQLVDMVDDLPQVVARLNLVLDFAENFTDLVFDRIGARRLLFEAVQVGNQFVVDEVPEVITGLRPVVVDLAIFVFGRSPHIPAVLLLEDVLVFFPLHGGFVGFVLL